MTKEELVDLLRKILRTEADLDFLLALEAGDLETLIVSIRDRVEKKNEKITSSGSSLTNVFSHFSQRYRGDKTQ